MSPIIHIEDEGYTFVYVRHSNVFITLATTQNSNAAMFLTFIYKMISVFESYFKHVREESIRDNFVIIYELLDEMIDFGYPQVSEPRVLKEYITQDFHVSELPSASSAITNAVSWRSKGVQHMRNEVFLDVVEHLNLTVSASGDVLRSEILGKLVMKCYLSGMPNLKLGLNDRLQFEATASATGREPRGKSVDLEDIKFHQCVRLARFEHDRSISFIPPDGVSELMSYRLNTRVKPLIWVDAQIEQRKTRVDYIVRARAQLKPRAIANNVRISIPTPSGVDTPRFKCTSGKTSHAPDREVIVWKIKQFKAGREHVMKGHFNITSTEKRPEGNENSVRRPISLQFEVPYFAISGLQVRFLKVVENSGYEARPWVRYITEAGDYQIRMV